jgi:hypothetical protein
MKCGVPLVNAAFPKTIRISSETFNIPSKAKQKSSKDEGEAQKEEEGTSSATLSLICLFSRLSPGLLRTIGRSNSSR